MVVSTIKRLLFDRVVAIKNRPFGHGYLIGLALGCQRIQFELAPSFAA